MVVFIDDNFSRSNYGAACVTLSYSTKVKHNHNYNGRTADVDLVGFLSNSVKQSNYNPAVFVLFSPIIVGWVEVLDYDMLTVSLAEK